MIKQNEKKKPANYWNYETCKQEALKCKSRFEFQASNCSAYQVARKNGWLNDICSHMVKIGKHKNYWTYDKIKHEAMKYVSKSSFIKNNANAYNIARNNNWLDDICKHMKRPVSNQFKWTYENCKEEAEKYKTKTELKTVKNAAYRVMLKNKWLNDFYIKKKKK